MTAPGSWDGVACHLLKVHDGVKMEIRFRHFRHRFDRNSKNYPVFNMKLNTHTSNKDCLSVKVPKKAIPY